ncbi:PepSY-associated TM helix domain-containing protein [Pseudoalteromonas sp. S16_S37]|uniref:PepSY-associated TM helix domain-containing protein n=1 Tax=Pseudoalteromonas sp. S16_S37 TaxID=2720228 RepID=UPI00168072C1|nr:PepSY-associated TM helix domain-containing protein [Pseudoalteromonas sp. S16_S37]MBD1583727.1 PepSY domain-containing protein [Pseudoalteromonas sp. S16_S37]
MKIRSDILRAYQYIHTWTGITAGLLLFIGFFAGAITMFAPHIDKWATPPTVHLPQVQSEQYDALIRAVFAKYPESQNDVKISFEQGHSPVTWYQQGNPRELRLDDQLWHASFNSTEELISHTRGINELSSLVDYLHRSAGLVGEVGHDHFGVYVLGVAAILYFLALVSGLILLLPSLTKSFFALRTNKGASRFWLDTHNLIGITSLPFHIVIAVTVIVFAFHDFFYAGLVKIYGDKPLFARQMPATVEFKVDNLPSLNEIMARAKVYAPDHQITEINLSRLNSKMPSASIQLVSDQHMLRGPKSDFLFMNPYTFEVTTSSITNGDQGIWGDIVTTMFGLHFGSYGGELGRWAYFIMGILGAVLFYTGNLLWIEKRRQQTLPVQSKSSRFMGKLTVGVAMGSILGVATSFALTKWIVLTSLNINQIYMWVYYSCFILTLLASFLFGMSQTAVVSQRLIAVLCLSLPATSLFALCLPSLSIWPANEFSSVVLELCAGVIGIIFWHMANKTKQRAYYGDQNSVWYVGDKNSTSSIKLSLSA